MEFEERLIVVWVRSTSEDEVFVKVELESHSELVVERHSFVLVRRIRERERETEKCVEKNLKKDEFFNEAKRLIGVAEMT